MAVTRVTTQDTTLSTSGTGNTVNWPAIPTPGDLLVAVVGMNDGGASISSAGWNLAANSGIASCAQIYYKTAGTGESQTFTIFDDTNASYCLVGLYEYTGFITPPSLDKAATSTNSSSLNIVSGTTAMTIGTQDVVIACGLMFASNTLSSWSNSFNARNTVTQPSFYLFTADNVATNQATFTTTATTTGSAAASQGAIAAFRSGPKTSLPENIGSYLRVGNGMSRSEVAN
jgi:hypothetical protein